MLLHGLKQQRLLRLVTGILPCSLAGGRHDVGTNQEGHVQPVTPELCPLTARQPGLAEHHLPRGPDLDARAQRGEALDRKHGAMVPRKGLSPSGSTHAMTTPSHTHASARVVHRGEGAFVSVVVRAVFALRPSGLCEPMETLDGLDGPLGALSDDAPEKPHADVVLVGHVAAHARPHAVVAFAVARGPDLLLRRRLVAFGPRTPRSGERAPVPRFPIGPAAQVDGPSADEPAGPWLLDPDAPRGPDGFGPLAPSKVEPSIAPPAQRLGPLRGGEQLLFVGLGERAEPFVARLPASIPYATLAAPGLAPTGVPLVGDTLAIDVDARRVLVTFRGLLRVEPGASPFPLHVVSGLAPVRAIEELRGAPRDWPRGAASPLPQKPPRSVDGLVLHDESGFVSRCFSWSSGAAGGERVLVVRGTFDVLADGPARLAAAQGELEGDLFAGDDPHAALVRAGDLAPHKPEVDVLVRGTAHGAPGQTSALVTLRLGPLEARVVAVGPRRWQSDRTPSAPGPLEPVPLTWESAYGGPGFADNPVGTGHAPGTLPPRLEDPSRLLRVQGERVRPVAFAPIAPSWPLPREAPRDLRPSVAEEPLARVPGGLRSRVLLGGACRLARPLREPVRGLPHHVGAPRRGAPSRAAFRGSLRGRSRPPRGGR
jgi:hypothetical protein